MGKKWDMLFHRNKYKNIVNTYDTLKLNCIQGINIFLKQNNRYWSDTYEFKEYLSQNVEDIRELQKQYDQEEQRKQEIRDRNESIKKNYKYGYEYYLFKENLKRIDLLTRLKMTSIMEKGFKPKLVMSYTPTAEQIYNDFDYIKKLENSIQILVSIKKDCPEGFVSCAKAHKVDPSSSLDPPYDITSDNFINTMTGLTDDIKYRQRVLNLCKEYPAGVRLVIDPKNIDDIMFLASKTEEIKRAEKDYQDLCELKKNNPEIVNLIIKHLCKMPNIKIEELRLDVICGILEHRQLISCNDVSICEPYLYLSNSQQKYIMSLPTPLLQKMYVLKHIFSAKSTSIESSTPEDCNPAVNAFMDDCKGIDIKGVSYNTYFETVSRLSKDNHSINSALSRINRHRKIVENLYNKEKDAVLPFSALTDVYYNKSLSQAIENAEVQRADATKAVTIMTRYPLGYKSLVTKGRIKDILMTKKASHDELKWIIANENVFKSEQAAKELEEKINRARRIISSNSIAVKRLMPNVNSFTLTPVQAEKVLSEETKISTLTRLFNKVASWEKTKGIPHYFFYWYYPTRFVDVTQESEYARKLIWNFKDGNYQEEVIDIVTQKLQSTFSSDCARLTLVCIPASTIEDNDYRYTDFSETVCDKLNMYNAFEKIIITKEKDPSHLGGMDSAEYQFEESFFSGKYVVLFDDVVTRGHSIVSFKNKLESFGAIVICAISIGRTYSDYYGDDRKPHPWSGIL